MPDLVSSIRENYQFTLDQIANAARKSNRDPKEIRLVVVTKSQPVEVAQAAIEAGVRLLGENYPEEGVMKIQSLTGQSGVEWHMIGHVQSRKARLVADHFALLHSLDSLKLAQRLDHVVCGRQLCGVLHARQRRRQYRHFGPDRQRHRGCRWADDGAGQRQGIPTGPVGPELE